MLQFKSQTMMPFCHAPARNPSGIHSYCLLLLFAIAPILGGEVPDAVKVGDTAIIPCNETCNGNLLWEFKTKNEKLDVLQCVRGTCTEGDRFMNRVSISEKFKAGNPSLKLYHVLFNDEGWYMVLCDSKFLCRFHLEVFVPTTVNATFGSNITLPCYARTEKRITDDAVNVFWKKDDQTVLQVQKGITNHGLSFSGRATVSLDHYKDGDLSLTIFWVTTADKGLYRCYHNTEEEHGHPGAVTLNVIAHQKFCAKKFGDNLTLDLFGSDPVTVTFTSSTETRVCSVSGNDAACSPEYTNRVSVVNYSLVVGMLTSSDTGTFTVKDKMGEVISINTVTVEGVTQRYYYVAPSVLAFFLSCCLFYWCHRKSQANANEYTGVTEPLREPACIGLSQEETSPNIPEESDVSAHTPVEETMPMRVTPEKQDNTEEEESILPLE
ncbi:uncharacterized protein si:dkey-22i16.9 [Rhinichthys klamathensis goyatoka]|uniref:uncharacterized protein si:dkey-22i16.9 n=1 Tax=Rhinichthys klamathensis goyatoka TaxID=3034132 RepID=UPI0024B5C8F5|nr:uncharacterized protein si:dkey-22i16.9 [Rhinichthys klamathensis goyatoka]